MKINILMKTGDLVVLRVEVIGIKGSKKMNYSYEMIDFMDFETNVTAMGRTTAYPTSIVSQMIARGELTERGVVYAEKIGRNPKTAEIFFKELAARKIHVKEIVSRTL